MPDTTSPSSPTTGVVQPASPVVRKELVGRVVVLAVAVTVGDNFFPPVIWSLAKAGVLALVLVLGRLQEHDASKGRLPLATQVVLALDLAMAKNRFASRLELPFLLLYTAQLGLIAAVIWRRGVGRRGIVVATYVVGLVLLLQHLTRSITTGSAYYVLSAVFPTPVLGVILAMWLIRGQQNEHTGGPHFDHGLTTFTAVIMWGWIPWLVDLYAAFWLAWLNGYPALAVIVIPNLLLALLSAPPVLAISIHAFYGYHIAMHVVGILCLLALDEGRGWTLGLYVLSLFALLASYRAGAREEEAAEVESNMRDFGTPVPPSTLHCPKCGTVNNAERWFCVECKTNLHIQ